MQPEDQPGGHHVDQDRYKIARENVEEFLARGGRIERIEDHPLPDGRVLLRGQRERQQQFALRALNTALN